MSCCAVASPGAQVDAIHPVAYLLPMRVDGDSCGDLVAWDGSAWHVWWGRPGPPFLREGPSTGLAVQRPFGRPIAAGRALWIASLGAANDPRWFVDVGVLDAGARVQRLATFAIEPDGIDRVGVWPRLVPPEPGDDVVTLLWVEVAVGRDAIFRAARLAPDGALRPVSLPLPGPAPQHGGWRIVDAFRAPPALRRPGEVVFVLAGTAAELAIGLCGPEPVTGLPELRGFQRIPAPVPVHPASWLGATSAAVYGGFRPSPPLWMPIVGFGYGGAVVIHPSVETPYVDRSGAMLWTSPLARFVAGAAADYDGDGADELVLLEAATGLRSLLLVVDPHPMASGGQLLRLPPGDPDPFTGQLHPLFHAAPQDVDGDRRLDLVASLAARNGASRLAVLRGVDGPTGRRLEPHW
ncbi:MAG: hypothetical protein IPM29_27960 [Planctomycetes bacterium]|nr:hypothetical protein [Planctomycetota bacterium]